MTVWPTGLSSFVIFYIVNLSWASACLKFEGAPSDCFSLVDPQCREACLAAAAQEWVRAKCGNQGKCDLVSCAEYFTTKICSRKKPRSIVGTATAKSEEPSCPNGLQGETADCVNFEGTCRTKCSEVLTSKELQHLCETQGKCDLSSCVLLLESSGECRNSPNLTSTSSSLCSGSALSGTKLDCTVLQSSAPGTMSDEQCLDLCLSLPGDSNNTNKCIDSGKCTVAECTEFLSQSTCQTPFLRKVWQLASKRKLNVPCETMDTDVHHCERNFDASFNSLGRRVCSETCSLLRDRPEIQAYCDGEGYCSSSHCVEHLAPHLCRLLGSKWKTGGSSDHQHQQATVSNRCETFAGSESDCVGHTKGAITALDNFCLDSCEAVSKDMALQLACAEESACSVLACHNLLYGHLCKVSVDITEHSSSTSPGTTSTTTS